MTVFYGCTELESVKNGLKITQVDNKDKYILIHNNTIKFMKNGECVATLDRNTTKEIHCKNLFFSSLFTVCTCLFFYFLQN